MNLCYCGVWRAVWHRVWHAFRQALACGARQVGNDVGPFGFAAREFSKDFGKFGPRTEAAFEGAMVVLAEVKVGATSGDFADPADDVGPIGEELAVFETRIDDVGPETGGADGVIPSREESRDLMLGNPGEGDEFRTRRRATGAAGDGSERGDNGRTVNGWFQRTFLSKRGDVYW